MADVVVVMSADEARLLAAMQKVVAKEAQVASGMTKIKQEGKAAGKQSEQAFGSGALSSLAGYASGLLSIGAAASSVTRLLSDMRAQSDAAAAAARSDVAGMGELAQVSASIEEYRHNLEEARKSFAAGAGATLGDAAKLQFSLISAGYEGDREFIAALASANVVNDPTAAVNAAQTLRSAFGEGEVGSFEDILSKALAASKPAPASAEAVLQASAGPAATAGALGLSEEEVLTAVSVVSKTAGGAGKADTQLTSLLTALAESGEYQGMTLREMVVNLRDQDLEFAELKEMLGRKEAVKGLDSLITQLDLYDQTLAETQRAAEEQLAKKALALPDQVAEIAAVHEQVAETAQRKLADTDIGSMANLAEAAIQSEQTATRQRFGGFGGSALNSLDRAYDSALRFAFGDEAVLRDRLYGSGFLGAMSDDSDRERLRQQYEAFVAQREAAEALKAAAEAQQAAARATAPSSQAIRAHQASQAAE